MRINHRYEKAEVFVCKNGFGAFEYILDPPQKLDPYVLTLNWQKLLKEINI